MIVNNVKLKKFTHNGQKVKKWIHNGVKVWSNGAEVSYYDGTNLLGTFDIEEGLDVLHPPIDTSKADYTLVGWALSDRSLDIIEEMVASDEPINLYAVYLPNTLVVAQGDVGTAWYTPQIKDERYISGSLGAEKRVTTGNDFVSCTFTVNSGLYQTVSGTTKVNGSLSGKSGWHQNEVTPNITRSGTYTVSSIFVAGEQSTYTCVVGVNQITLSNPKAWV